MMMYDNLIYDMYMIYIYIERERDNVICNDMIHGAIWWCLMIYGDAWRYMTVYDDLRLYAYIYIYIYVGIWWDLLLYNDISWYIMIYGHIWMIYNGIWGDIIW